MRIVRRRECGLATWMSHFCEWRSRMKLSIVKWIVSFQFHLHLLAEKKGGRSTGSLARSHETRVPPGIKLLSYDESVFVSRNLFQCCSGKGEKQCLMVAPQIISIGREWNIHR